MGLDGDRPERGVAAGESSGWVAVRCTFRSQAEHRGAEVVVYEERVTSWREADVDRAIERAEAEVFSSMRTSDRPPTAYLDRFFDTGQERRRDVDESDEPD